MFNLPKDAHRFAHVTGLEAMTGEDRAGDNLRKSLRIASDSTMVSLHSIAFVHQLRTQWLGPDHYHSIK
jgi:hypothetical protein